MAQPVLKHIPLDQLKISRLNMRSGRKNPDITDILPSIRARGVRQTLLVRKEGKGFGIVAGRRRYFALKQIAKEQGDMPLVPCAIMPEDDAASAIEASMIENVARLPASEMEQYTAFKQLADQGRSIDEIADFFGVTELRVRRIMALASLAPAIRNLYDKGDIDRATIRALTLATKAQQKAWLELFNSPEERAPLGRSCKAWVTGGTIITTDKALFELETYKGQITGDLFGEHGVFAEPAAFWAAQSIAIAAKVEKLRATGWADVVCLDRGQYFHSWDYVETAKDQGGKVFVEVRHDGSVIFHEGYLTQADARRLENSSSAGEQPSIPIKPEMSGPLTEYVSLHRHAIAQASLLKRPDVALRLILAHALSGSALWDVRAHVCRTKKESTRASIETSKALQEVNSAKASVSQALKEKGLEEEPRRNSIGIGLPEAFAALLQMSDTEINDVIAFTMTETLEAGSSAVEAVLHVCQSDPSSYWTPDEAFFDLLRDKRAINAMVEEIGSKEAAAACQTDTTKAQKQILSNHINGVECDANPDWRPGWLAVPPTGYIEGASCAPVDVWTRISHLFRAINGR